MHECLHLPQDMNRSLSLMAVPSSKQQDCFVTEIGSGDAYSNGFTILPTISGESGFYQKNPTNEYLIRIFFLSLCPPNAECKSLHMHSIIFGLSNSVPISYFDKTLAPLDVCPQFMNISIENVGNLLLHRNIR